MTEGYDIAIVGAGPAGSSLAIRLAAAGKRVLLVEKDSFPRHKLCGEFISPECLDHFACLGVLDDMRSAGGSEIDETVFYGRRGSGVAVPSSIFGGSHRAALSLSRSEMDLRMLRSAAALGVDVRERTSAALRIRNGKAAGLDLRTTPESGGRSHVPIEAPLVIDATGRTRSLTRKLSPRRSRRPKFVAFKTHARGVDVPDARCEIFSYRGGYCGTSRVEGGLHNICFIVRASDLRRLASDPDRVLREIVCTNKRAETVFRETKIQNEWLAVPLDSFGRGEISPLPGLIAVGDAAAFIDPFTGSGMLLALESSAIASECILNSLQPEAEYERRYSRAFNRRLRACSWIRTASFIPFLAEALIIGLGLSNTLKNRVAAATRSAAPSAEPTIR